MPFINPHTNVVLAWQACHVGFLVLLKNTLTYWHEDRLTKWLMADLLYHEPQLPYDGNETVPFLYGYKNIMKTIIFFLILEWQRQKLLLPHDCQVTYCTCHLLSYMVSHQNTEQMQQRTKTLLSHRFVCTWGMVQKVKLFSTYHLCEMFSFRISKYASYFHTFLEQCPA